jgi:DNA-binding NarL/FixJ family response regulator
MKPVDACVVDGSELIRELLSTMLRRLRPAMVVVELASDMELHRHVTLHGAPTMLSIDPIYPDARGSQFVRWTRQLCPSTRMLVYSALPAIELRVLCGPSVADLHLEKSASATETLKTLHRLLRLANQ